MRANTGRAAVIKTIPDPRRTPASEREREREREESDATDIG